MIAYQDDLVTLYQGECMEIMPVIASVHSVDAIITDPPYEETSCRWDRWPVGWVKQAAGLSQSLWCFGSVRMFMRFQREFAGWEMSQDIVWEKHNGSGMATDRFRRVHEVAAHFYRGPWANIYHQAPRVTIEEKTPKRVMVRGNKPTHWGKSGASPAYVSDGTRQMRSVIYARSCHGYAIHPTQKPEELIAPLIEYSVPPGGSVLDCFAGSATTLIVARRMGRKAIGIEGDAEMVAKAVARLSAKPIEAAA